MDSKHEFVCVLYMDNLAIDDGHRSSMRLYCSCREDRSIGALETT